MRWSALEGSVSLKDQMTVPLESWMDRPEESLSLRLNEIALNESGFAFDPHSGECFRLNESAIFIGEFLGASQLGPLCMYDSREIVFA